MKSAELGESRAFQSLANAEHLRDLQAPEKLASFLA